MPPNSETMTGIAGETIVWLTAATSMPSISPTKITFLWPVPFFVIYSPSVLLQPLRQTRDARGIDLEPVANLSLAHAFLIYKHRQEKPRRRAEAHLTLEGVLHPPEGEPQKRHHRVVASSLLRQQLVLLLRISVM